MKNHSVLNLKNIMIKLCLIILVYLHNISYKLISKFAIIENNGTHPKHALMNYHQFFVDHMDGTDVVLDIGCGSGENAFDISQKAKEVYAIDYVEKKIRNAEKKYAKHNLHFIYGDVLKYNFQRSFDKIVLSNVLEHIESRIDFLSGLQNISNTILLRIPMRDRDWLTVYKKDHGFEYRLDPTHFIEYTLNDLKQELLESGWGIVEYSIQFGEFWGVIKRNDL